MQNLIKSVVLALVLSLAYPSDLAIDAPRHFSSEDCLAANLFFEARGESMKGMQAVAAVTINRLKHKNYPSDLCTVVFQPKQFSWTHQEKYSRIVSVLDADVSDMSRKDELKFHQARLLAAMHHDELTRILPKNTIFYHSKKVNPKWAAFKVKVASLGNHIFYKE